MAIMSLSDCLLLLELENKLLKNKNPWNRTMYSIGSEFKKAVEMKGIVKVIVVEVVTCITCSEVNGGKVGRGTRKSIKHTC